ncbi:hypothetical protein COLO4_34283 [Corchorus olitorius]|uniref:Uncharacterized protein n=1 Tax=Corchorus olitorius TaxID=93759 RepID=A0A1R3GMA1_9ROSI|nr:hypothetical protein COLO4_34283 [Corchorus olitorius]
MKPANSRFAPIDVPSPDLASTLSNTDAETFKKFNPNQNFEAYDLSDSPSNRLGFEVKVCCENWDKDGATGELLWAGEKVAELAW